MSDSSRNVPQDIIAAMLGGHDAALGRRVDGYQRGIKQETERRIERLKVKARTQIDLAWNKAIDETLRALKEGREPSTLYREVRR